jgi:hypothetical protein
MTPGYPFRLTESFDPIQNSVKPKKIGGEVDHNAAADTEKLKGVIR